MVLAVLTRAVCACSRLPSYTSLQCLTVLADAPYAAVPVDCARELETVLWLSEYCQWRLRTHRHDRREMTMSVVRTSPSGVCTGKTTRCRPSQAYRMVVLCCTVLHCAALCYTVLHCVALCCTVLQHVHPRVCAKGKTTAALQPDVA